MTKDEAIVYWKQRSKHIHNWLKENEDVDFVGEYVDAIDIAIESLSADTVSRSQYQGLLNAIGKVYVEVVRCKDCRYFKKIVERSDSGLCHRDLVASSWKDNGYCSRGKRRKESEDEK